MSFGNLLVQLLLAASVAAEVYIDRSLIHTVDRSLPIYRLEEPALLQSSLFQSVVNHVSPHAVLKRTKGGLTNAYNGDTVIGFINSHSGETRVFGQYGTLEPVHHPVDIHEALSFVKQGNEGFPEDDTTIKVVKGPSLRGGTYDQADLKPTEEQTFLTHARVERFIDVDGTLYPVCGPGSEAIFGVGAGNQILAISHRWKVARRSDQATKPNSTEVVVDTLRTAFAPLSSDTQDVKITTVDVCFYDSGDAFIQPVFHVVAEASEKNSMSPKGVFSQYFAIGSDSPEGLPPLPNAGDGQHPTPEPASNEPLIDSISPLLVEQNLQRRVAKPNIRVGRYLVRSTDPVYDNEFLTNSRNSWNALVASPATNLFDFTNTHFSYANQYLYNGGANSYINYVNLAFTEAYGNYHLFTTYTSCCEVVFIPSGIPASGYGSGVAPLPNFYRLGYWFIDASEVMPVPIDFPGTPNPVSLAYSPWLPVLGGGMHGIASFRTLQFFSDNVAAGAAARLAKGQGVMSAWIDAAITDPSYRRSIFYRSRNGLNVPYGRPSAIWPCGHGGDLVSQLDNLGRVTCYEWRYYDNTAW